MGSEEERERESKSSSVILVTSPNQLSRKEIRQSRDLRKIASFSMTGFRY